ncbi:hypothetical protein C6I20_13940 [Aeromicrobium sp. A1-2]|uniref:type IV toxin-antitoxin system AbiEi family antitoxin domain-containing protein n=1 Tax=Aeromicrobium sp. A1-2 TaxID=2107713 RepID=UPI000E49300D|nr:type IV toxin-antitoxin system AbiEi family antitoxin domain-containing protein [Aeromicrobium sp. A1-2]AXT86171.1 hypothetical protein C6I20_13940 [Aeromicrobium sp. A1-2]
MDDVFLALAVQRGGYFFRHDLIACGFGDPQIRAAVRAGRLARLRHGTYAPSALVAPLSPEERHVLVAYSVADKLGPGVALSHHSAALVHSGHSFGLDLKTVHVTQLNGVHGRREAGVVFHVGHVRDADLVEIGGRLIVAPARAAFETACIAPTESGMVTMSAVLHDRHCTREELVEVGERLERWPGGRHARLAIRLADSRCESVGESRSLHMFWREGIPRPELQVVVRTEDGRVVARTDFAWLLHRHTGEFDGLFKYGRLNPYRDDLGRAVTDEKKREDLVRSLMLGMSRWTWEGLNPDRRQSTARDIHRGLERSKRLYARNATHIPLAV